MAKRRVDYTDRRSDGYTEPLELYVLGTSHVSDTSAGHVRRVMQAVRPQSVVVEVRFLPSFLPSAVPRRAAPRLRTLLDEQFWNE